MGGISKSGGRLGSSAASKTLLGPDAVVQLWKEMTEEGTHAYKDQLITNKGKGGAAPSQGGNNDQGSSTNGEFVSLQMPTFLNLLTIGTIERAKRVAAPASFVIQSLSISGFTQISSVCFTANVEVSVLSQSWIACPLFSASEICVSSATITQKNNRPKSSTRGGRELQETAQTESTSEADSCERAQIGILNGKVCLITCNSFSGSEGASDYVVSLQFSVQYQSFRGKGCKIEIPQTPLNELEFSVLENDVLVSVDPSHSVKQETVPITDSDREEFRFSGSTAREQVLCSFPSSSYLNIQWKSTVPEYAEDLAGTELGTKEAEKMLVTAVQGTLYSIGEGLVTCKTYMSFNIVHGTKSVFDIVIPKKLKILQVECPVLSKWEVLEVDDALLDVNAEDEQTAENGEGDENADPNVQKDKGKARLAEVAVTSSIEPTVNRIVRVRLDYGVEGSHEIFILSEYDMQSTSCKVGLPIFSCLNVDRERGFLAVEARTNVEIQEESFNLLTKVDVNELKDTSLYNKNDNPLLLAYKYLVKGYDLTVDVTKHEDVNVLIAIIENAWIVATHSDGKTLFKCTLEVRNTQKQFLLIKIPRRDSVELWSSTVAGSAVKPAQDTSGSFLIPLEKSSADGDSGDDHKAFYVELVYFFESPESDLKIDSDRGKLCVELPEFDIPINRLYVTMYLPEEYTYSNFDSAGLKKVRALSKKPPSPKAVSAGSSSHASRIRPGAPAPQMQSNMMMSNMGFNDDFDEVAQEAVDDFNIEEQVMAAPNVCYRGGFGGGGQSMKKKKMMNRGVIPVQVSSVESGIGFYLEALLIRSQTLHSVGSFASSSTQAQPAEEYEKNYSRQPREYQSWDFYFNSTSEEVPLYKVELAKSGRSRCTMKSSLGKKCYDTTIPKGEIRVGSINEESGTYGRWCHLDCWRVPSKIWSFMPPEGSDPSKFEAALFQMNELLFCGFDQLSQSERDLVVAHVMDESHWARKVGGKKSSGGEEVKKEEGYGQDYEMPRFARSIGYGEEDYKKKKASSGKRKAKRIDEMAYGSDLVALDASFGSHYGLHEEEMDVKPSMVSKREKKKIKKDESISVYEDVNDVYTGAYGHDDMRNAGVLVAVPSYAKSNVLARNTSQEQFLEGKRVVLSGIFPEVGGGTGLNLGKDRLKSILQSHGATITSAVSGKTDYLLIGDEPGASKVSKAESQPRCQIVCLNDFKLAVQGQRPLDEAPVPEIESFSKGYFGNGIGRITAGSGWRKPAGLPAPKRKKYR
eukprot:Nk52_evm22s2152 gene=Nk52_evmTU22s2152